MLKDKMVVVTDPVSLASSYSQLAKNQHKIYLWQNVTGEKGRLCQEAQIAAFHPILDEMVFYPKRGDFRFIHHSYVFFLCTKRATIFKATMLYHSPLKLIIRTPQKIMMVNNRSEERIQVGSAGNFIHYTHNPKHNPQLDQLYLQSRLLDLSSGGLAFRSSINNVVRFKKDDQLFIKSPLRPQELQEGQISYVTRIFDGSSEEYLRVGVRLL